MPDVTLRDGTHCEERYACRCEECSKHPDGPLFAEDRYSLGIYAGRMCDRAWDKSGYKKGGYEEFNPSYAGETYWEDGY